MYPLKNRNRSKNFNSQINFKSIWGWRKCLIFFSFSLTEETYKEFITMFKCFEMWVRKINTEGGQISVTFSVYIQTNVSSGLSSELQSPPKHNLILIILDKSLSAQPLMQNEEKDILFSSTLAPKSKHRWPVGKGWWKDAEKSFPSSHPLSPELLTFSAQLPFLCLNTWLITPYSNILGSRDSVSTWQVIELPVTLKHKTQDFLFTVENFKMVATEP